MRDFVVACDLLENLNDSAQFVDRLVNLFPAYTNRVEMFDLIIWIDNPTLQSDRAY